MKHCRLVRSNGTVLVIEPSETPVVGLFDLLMSIPGMSATVELHAPDYVPGKFVYEGEGVNYLHYKEVDVFPA